MQKKSNSKNKGSLSKWYYPCLYAFDHEHLVRGPFESEKKCWETMRKEAKVEYRIDLKENEYSCNLVEDQQAGEITLTDFFDDHTNETKWVLFEIKE